MNAPINAPMWMWNNILIWPMINVIYSKANFFSLNLQLASAFFVFLFNYNSNIYHFESGEKNKIEKDFPE